jgi:hypothetical protein
MYFQVSKYLFLFLFLFFEKKKEQIEKLRTNLRFRHGQYVLL